MRRLVVLRPEPGSSATVERARTMGLDAIAVPLFEVRALQWQAPDPSSFDALLLTSANAVRCAGEQLEHLAHLPAYAVGGATAAAARDRHLSVAAVGHGSIDDLLPLIPAELRLVHLCSRQRRGISASDRAITPIEVYSAEPLEAPRLPDSIHGAVAAVHSPRAGARLAELVGGLERQGTRIAAISPAAAEAAGIGWSMVEFAQLPTDDALLALAARLCEEDCRQ